MSPLRVYLGHRIILPVYIPVADGYYADALRILDACLASLVRTSAGRASITVVDNGSHAAVHEALNVWCERGLIDQLVVNRSNRGKVDSVVPVARGAFEQLISVVDGDVLFLDGWLEAVEGVFAAFPECGTVSPHPVPNLAWHLTSSTLLGALARGELRYASVVPVDDLGRFAASVGTPGLFSDENRRRQLIVRRSGLTACVGSAHFATTYRREAVQALPATPSLSQLGARADRQWLDEPVDRAGFWRLATTQAFVRHMGNVYESWMDDERHSCRAHAVPPAVSVPSFARGWPRLLPWTARLRIASGLRHVLEGDR